MRRLIQLALPAVLLGVGYLLLTGCLPIPTFEKPVRGENASRQVGDEQSEKPLKISRATRGDVLRVLGQPYIASSDGRTLAYTWSVQNAVTVWPLCFYAHPVHGERTLVLRFDETGVLRSTKVLKADEPVMQLLGEYEYPSPLPDDLKEEINRRQKELHEKSRKLLENTSTPTSK